MFKSYYGQKFNPFEKSIDITNIYESRILKQLGQDSSTYLIPRNFIDSEPGN